jgi:hypothetical protein
MRTNEYYAKSTDHRAYKNEITDNPLRLALWNANGLTQHAEELRTFISYHKIYVMLISETHFTEKNTSNYHSTQSTTQTIQPEPPEAEFNHRKKLYPA